MSEDGLEGRLKVEAGCIRMRTWRLEVPRTTSASALATALVAQGWADETRFTALRELRHPGGHHVLLVPETGRVQIRLDLAVPEPEREQTARIVAGELLETVRRVEGTPAVGAT